MTTHVRRCFVTAVIAVALSCCSEVEAGLLSSFQDAMQPTTPAAGWSYLWNRGGAIGNPANYTSLLPTTDPAYYYDCDGINGVPGPEPGAYIFLGLVPSESKLLNTGQPGGHPGRGRYQDSSGIERYAIAAYTLSTGGSVFITDSLLTNADSSPGGLDVEVYVNSNFTPLLSAFTQGGKGQTASFDGSLGALNAGDTIYVAIGANNGFDSADCFSLRYGIAAVPEPSSIVLLVIGAIAAWVWRRRRLWLGLAKTACVSFALFLACCTTGANAETFYWLNRQDDYVGDWKWIGYYPVVPPANPIPMSNWDGDVAPQWPGNPSSPYQDCDIVISRDEFAPPAYVRLGYIGGWVRINSLVMQRQDTIDTCVELRFDGSSFFNNGTFIVNPGGSLGVSQGLAISGSGSVTLCGGAIRNSSGANGVYPYLENGQYHTIQGYGQFGSLTFANYGTVDANDPGGQSLKFTLAGLGNVGLFTNYNVVRASNGGLLQLSSGVYTNHFTDSEGVTHNGRIEALDNSVVQFDGSSCLVDGGELYSSGSGKFTLAPNSSGMNALQGTITNNALVEVGALSTLCLYDGTVLNGSGKIRLTDSDSATINPKPGTLAGFTNAPTHTICGTGKVGGSSLLITNQGLIQADQGGNVLTVSLNYGTLDNQGTIEAVNGGTLVIGGGNPRVDNMIFNTGTIAAKDGSSVQISITGRPNGNISGTVLDYGTWQVSDAGQGASMTISAYRASATKTIGSHATVVLDGPNATLSISGTRLDDSLTTIQGTLKLLNGRSMTSSGAIGNSGTLALGQAAQLFVQGDYSQSSTGITQGVGTLATTGRFVDDGVTIPGFSPGILDVVGDYEQHGTGLLLMEVFGAGTAGTDYDRFDVSGNALLSGTIQVDFEGYTPSLGDSWTLITSGGLLTADNPTISILGLDPSIHLTSTFDSHSYTLSVVSVPEPGSITLLALAAIFGLIWSHKRRYFS